MRQSLVAKGKAIMLVSLWFVDFLKGNLLILYGKIFLTANGFFIWQEILTFQSFLVGSLELITSQEFLIL
jgi:hypothetical protein